MCCREYECLEKVLAVDPLLKERSALAARCLGGGKEGMNVKKWAWPKWRRKRGESLRHFIERGIGSRLSRLGETLGWDALTYNRLHFRHFHELGVHCAPLMYDAMLSALPPVGCLIDVGSGTGAFAA